MSWEIKQKDDEILIALDGAPAEPFNVAGKNFICLEKANAPNRMRVYFWQLDPSTREYVAAHREFPIENEKNQKGVERLSGWEKQPAPNSK